MNSSDAMSNPKSDEVDFLQIVRVIWKYKYLIALVSLIAIAISVAAALTATHKYRAQVVVTKTNVSGMAGTSALASQLGGLAGLAGMNFGSSGVGYEAQAILASRHLIAEFVRKNDLVPVILPSETERSGLWFAVRRFQESVLSINEDAAEGITAVVIEWTDPIVAARWANDFVALANDLIRARALDDATRNIEFLNKQIERTTVVEVQRALYNLIETETKNLMLANVRAEYAFRIVDPAVPPEIRSSPRRKLMVASGAAVGLVAGVLLALILNFIHRLRSET